MVLSGTSTTIRIQRKAVHSPGTLVPCIADLQRARTERSTAVGPYAHTTAVGAIGS